MGIIKHRRWLTVVGYAGALILSAQTVGAHPMQAFDVQVLSGASPFSAECGPEDKYRGQEYEPSGAANPSNRDHLIATWTQDYNLGTMAAASVDGGITWTTTPIPNVTRCTGGTFDWTFDGRAAIGPDGIAYVAGVRAPCVSEDCVSVKPLQVFVSRSEDGGLTWSEQPAVVAEAGVMDYTSIAADPSTAGAVNVAWSEGGQATYFARSTDGGLTWSNPRPIRVASKAGVLGLSELIVLENGNLVLVHTDLDANTVAGTGLAGSASVSVVHSEDHGASWSEPRTLLELPGESDVAAAGAGQGGSAYIAVRTPTNHANFAISLLTSNDGGKTWSDPVLIPTSDNDAFGPRVAVAADRTIGVTYLDHRNDVPGDGQTTTNVWLAHSHDGGKSWSESRVGEPFDASRFDFNFDTDWQWVVGDGNRFVAIFRAAPANASGGQSDIYAAALSTGRRVGR